MINPKELRIGNLVCVPIEDFISEPKNGYATKVFQVVQILGINKDINRFEPIPITEEWLERFGFKKSIHRHGYIIYSQGIIGDIKYNIVFRDIEVIRSWSVTPDELKDDISYYSLIIGNMDDCYLSSFRIKYIHQLQNSFYFTVGEEIELKD